MFEAYFKYPEPPAKEQQIRDLLSQAGLGLPSTYLEFLKQTNGAEWALVDEASSSLVMWSSDEVFENTEAYDVAEFAPGLLLIGSDGGGEAVALDTRDPPDPDKWAVVMVPFSDLSFDSMVQQATSFSEWAETGFQIQARDESTR